MNTSLTYVRHRAGEDLIRRDRQFGPKQKGHPSIGMACPLCCRAFVAGDTTTLLPLGPAPGDLEQVARAREGRYYTATAVEIHWTCAGGRF